MKKSDMEIAFRKMMEAERKKKVTKWPDGDVRRDITVILWDAKEKRKEEFSRKKSA